MSLVGPGVPEGMMGGGGALVLVYPPRLSGPADQRSRSAQPGKY